MHQSRNKKLFLLGLFVGLFFGGIFLTVAVVLAQTAPDLGLAPVQQALGAPSTDIRTIVANIIRIFLGLLGVIAVALMIYAGAVWMTSGGSEEKIEQAKKILTNATIGLVIILSAYAIVSFVITRLLSATSGYPEHCFDGILNEDEEKKDCGGSCAPCQTECTNPPCGFSNVFFVEKLPAAGNVCIRNVKLAIMFSEAVDINTVNENTVIVKKQSDSSIVSGSWQLGGDKNVAVFVPDGSCSPVDSGNDCFASSTGYILDIDNGRQGEIKNASGSRSLNCGLKAKCEPVVFFTGDGVDRNPPTVSLELISPFQSGLVMPAKINFTDDNGLQNASLYTGSYYVGSQSLSECTKSGQVTIDWSTANMMGNIDVRGVGIDWAGNRSEDKKTVTLRPFHCFNHVQDVVDSETGIDCGISSGCGACDSSKCSNNSDCASGFCYKNPVTASEGVCMEKLKINSVNPLSGAVGDYITISGDYFGSAKGKVYFYKGIEASSFQNLYSDPGLENKEALSVLTDSSTLQYEFAAAGNNNSHTSVKLPVPGNGHYFYVGKIIPAGLDDSVSYNASVMAKDTGGGGNQVWFNTKISRTNNPKSEFYNGVWYEPSECTSARYFCITNNNISSSWGEIGVTIPSGFGQNSSLIIYYGINKPYQPSGLLLDDFNFAPNAPTVGWVEGPLANCGPNSKTWTPWQIIAEVPAGASALGPIKVVAASSDVRTTSLKTDTTNDSWGPVISDFIIGGPSRPSLCPLVPDHGKPNDAAALIGKNFGTSGGEINFGNSKSAVQGWANALVNTKVPNLDKGSLGVYLKPSGKAESNSVYFYVDDAAGANNPVISDISPKNGAVGEYITITGNKFGATQGMVWFKKGSDQALNGDNTFPADCSGATWSDTQIIIKAPSNTVGDYSVWISTSDNRISAPVTFTLELGVPAPGICKIVPSSGPIPFAAGGSMEVYGEYFKFTSGTVQYGSLIYFWKPGASSTSIVGRSVIDSFISSTANFLQFASPPLDAVSGQVTAYHPSDKKLGNGVAFTVNDCVKNNGCTESGYQCCASGDDQGICIPATELCSGQTRSAGYVWRFSTRDIPVPLTVVEKCDEATESGLALPTPSPSTIWNRTGFPNDDHINVCRGANVEIEFSRGDVSPLASDGLLINECETASVDVANRFCVPGTSVSVKDQNNNTSNFVPSASSKSGANTGRDYLELNPQSSYNSGKWKDNTWYRVVLRGNISAGSGTSTINLSKTKPCDIDGNKNTTDEAAYCFLFKTGAQDCRLREVIITPYSYWTNYLESPLKEHSVGGDISDLFYSGHGLSDQRCIMMNVNDFNWQWSAPSVDGINYANIYSNSTSVKNVQISSLQNTVGVNLISPDNAVNINAVASAGTKSYPASSPLTIDLSDPKVVDYWPNCLETCTDAEIGARFNLTMSNSNLSHIVGGPVQLLKCLDENCLSTELVGLTSLSLNSVNGYTVLQISPSSTLEKQTIYKVVLSNKYTPAPKKPTTYGDVLWSASRYGDPTSFSKPMNSQFVWRFRTKKEACKIDRVEVLPKVFNASNLTAKTIYSAQPYSSPDACNATGQKLNAANANWDWSSSATNIAVTTEFVSKGYNPFCTAGCVRKGSDVPAGSVDRNLRVCGNGVVEAGEDCDPGTVASPIGPSASLGCGLNCLTIGKTKSGSKLSTGAQDVSASICGNGYVGVDEDCDLGIDANPISTSSSMGCSANCLHQGTRLSTAWCYANTSTFGGFTSASYNAYCAQAYSQCDDKVQNPDEDPGCDDSITGWDSVSCNEFCLKKNQGCTATTGGCLGGNYLGSSLLYSEPSICGDGTTGMGEVKWCEDNIKVVKTDGFVNPWALATGVGLGNPTGEPPAQRADIAAKTNTNTSGGTYKSNSGQFIIKCGFQSDEECKTANNADPKYGVADNSCCFVRSQLTEVYPGVTTTDSFGHTTPNKATNVCPNTYISANFDQMIDSRSLVGNFIIARGTASASCDAGEENVTGQVTVITYNATPSKWYASMWQKIVYFFKNLIGSDAQALATNVDVVTWCAGKDVGSAEVLPDTYSGGSKIKVNLKKPLAFNTDYAIILGSEIKDTRGVKVGQVNNKNIFWRFSTGGEICTVNGVDVSPSQYYFSTSGSTTTIEAKAWNSEKREIQSIPGFYAWDILWGPQTNNFVGLIDTTSSINIATAKNQNGEIDIRASVNITADKYTNTAGLIATGRAHFIVFLCENPWPPKDLIISGAHNIIFPYEDKVGNNDDYSIVTNTFTGLPTAASPVGVGYFNFATYYCADNGSTGSYDDLPYLRPAVQVSNNLVSVTSSLKRFLFTNDRNSDAIGVQVFPNTKHLTAEQWFKNSGDFGGQSFKGILQNLKVNGYDAVSDGNNIYIDGMDLSSPVSNPVSGDIYTNIYLFSINADAKPETRNVFDQIIKNLEFNTNLTNDNYCGASVNNPGATTTCFTDFDCPNGEVCSAQIDMLKRDYQRLRDLSSIEKLLSGYYFKNQSYPDLKEGSYLSGQTLSTWPSWSVLGNAVGSGFASDPVNKLAQSGSCSSSTGQYCLSDGNCPTGENCVLHDATTGWSTADRRFSFACNSSSLAYRYIFSTSTGYKVYSKFENHGLQIDNLYNFLTYFISSTARFSIFDYGGYVGNVCLPGETITTMQAGRCGDGKLNVNLNEVCDPPGFKDYETGCTANGGTAKNLNICNEGCKGWTASTTPCVSFSKCGNGKVESGETCDDGVLNGDYNHCDAPNQNPAKPLGCQSFGYKGFCGDGRLDSKYEACDTEASKCKFSGITVPSLSAPSPIFYFLVDLSSSMNTAFGATTRLDYIKQQLPLVVGAFSSIYNIKVGIGSFSSMGTFKERMRVDSCNQSDVTSVMQDSTFSASGVNYTGPAIKWVNENVFNNLSNADKQRPINLVLLTGGDETTTGVVLNDRVLAQIQGLRQKGIKTYVAGINYTSQNFTDWAAAGGTSPYLSVSSPNFNLKSALVGIYIDQGCRSYSSEENRSCKFDCSGLGSFCGDGQIDSFAGEECETDQVCSINGVSGFRKCVGCAKKDGLATLLWKFEDFSSTGCFGVSRRVKDEQQFGRLLFCDVNKCPSIASGKVGNAMFFNGTSNWFHSQTGSTVNWNNFSLSVWINPASDSYSKIVEKDGISGKSGFTLGYGDGLVSFDTVYGYDTSPRFTRLQAEAQPDDWSHVVATYSNNVVSLYVNGELQSSTSTPPMVASTTAEISIGRASNQTGGSYYYFNGGIDELAFYPGALTAAEVKDLSGTNWLCVASTTPTPIVPVTPGAICGDGKIDTLNDKGIKEECDNGKNANGVACQNGYNKSCSYCSADCSSVIFREATGYCGDGIVTSTEKCDVDPRSGVIYSKLFTFGKTGAYDSTKLGYQVNTCSVEKNFKVNLTTVSSTNNWAELLLGYPGNAGQMQTILNNLKTFRKGTKLCSSDCAELQDSCVECGLSPTGSEIKGALINVLEPTTSSTSKYKTPLYYDYASPKTGWKTDNIGMYFTDNITQTDGYVTKRVASHEVTTAFNGGGIPTSLFNSFALEPALNSVTSPGIARVNADPMCSATTTNNNARYTLIFNNDHQLSHAVYMNVVPNPAPWQYDQVVSPIIRLSNYNISTQDNTAVLARPYDVRVVVRWVDDRDVFGGFVIPATPNTILEGASFSQKAIGVKYYNNFSAKMSSIWYHGFSTIESKTSVEAFTVDTSASPNSVAFYVRTPEEYNMKNLSSSMLQVEVYVPESESYIGDTSWRHFSRPAVVYYLKDAIPSDNPQARYWHVFNINKTVTGNASLNNINDKNLDGTKISRVLTSDSLIKFSY